MAELFYSIAIVAGIIYIIFSKNKPLALLTLYIASLPFFGLMYDIGVQINLDRFWALFMVLFITFYGLKIKRELSIFIMFLVFAFFITIVLSQFLPDTTKNFPALRGEYRYLVQIFMWILLSIPTIFIVRFLREEEDIKNLYKVFIFSCFILSVFGISQWISINYFGYDPFPIGILEIEEKKRLSYFISKFEGLKIIRISSLGGEPKHFAFSIAHILPLLITSTYLNVIKFKFYFVIVLLMLINLFLTFSTQGYFLFCLNMMISIIFLSLFKGLNKKLALTLLITIIILVFILINPTIYDIVKLRTIERFLGEGFVEDWNQAVIDFLINNPQYALTGVGLGNIHLHAQQYIPDYALFYMLGEVFVAKSGALRIVSEIGIIGFLIFTFSYMKPLIYLFKTARFDNFILLNLIVGTYTLVSFLLTSDGPCFIFVILGFLYSSYILYKRKIS